MRNLLVVTRELIACARHETALARWRAAAIELVASVVAHDVAVFHELSPRRPLAHAALVAVDPSWLASTVQNWDAMAVAFEAMTHDAMAHGGVAIASRAFAGRSKQRRIWQATVARPLRVHDVCMLHLTAHHRVQSALVLGRAGAGNVFDDASLRILSSLEPVLAVCDALVQASSRRPRGMKTRVECADGRLTPHQQRIVELVALGHSNSEIAHALGISPHTVRNLLVSVCGRLGAANRAEVVHRAAFR
jgi:DNA-binding CsgD family transcriptional regulator